VKTSRRSLILVAAVAAVFTLSACESDPSPTRIAQDLVKTETEGQPKVQECMLAVIDDYDLDQLGEDSVGDNAEKAKAADAELAKFEADLAACR
jgi:protein tyrosine/serine phosphatase